MVTASARLSALHNDLSAVLSFAELKQHLNLACHQMGSRYRACRMSDTTPAYLREQARRCRRLADSAMDERVSRTLRAMADEYDENARKLSAQEAKQKPKDD